MNFQQLRSVREAVRRGFNLTEVANALATSQPGVSRQIRELEAAIANEPKKPRTDLSATYMKYSDLKSQLESTNQRRWVVSPSAI